MIKPLVKSALICAALIPLFAMFFLWLMTFAMSFDDDHIRENILSENTHLNHEAINTFNGRRIDLYTECIGVSLGVMEDIGAPHQLSKRAVRAPVSTSCRDMKKGLAIIGGKSVFPDEVKSFDYYRYWHGYGVISRPLLSVMGYADFRGLVFLVTSLLGALVFMRLNKDFSLGFAAATALPFLFINFAGPLMLITKAAAWWVCFGGILYLASSKRLSSLPYISFFILGALTAFTDFLSTPIVNFALPVLIYYFYSFNQQEGSAFARPYVSLFILLCFWMIGYAGLWAAKFILAMVVLGPEVWEPIMEQINFRLRGTHENVSSIPGTATLKNIEALKSLWAPLAIIILGIMPFTTPARRLGAKMLWQKAQVFIVIGFIPIIWMELLSNHSQIHGTFTHVNFVVPFIILSLILLCQTKLVTNKG